MFEHWDSFYLLVGGAAGALIGLLFVVATLTQGRDRDSALRGASIYMSPVVMHLGLVLALSALATAPAVHLPTAAALLALGGLVGAGASARVVYSLSVRRGLAFQPHWTDVWFYGVAPLAADLVLAASAAAALAVTPQTGARIAAIGLVATLLIAIRNAWDLVTWISATTHTGEPGAPS